MTAVSRSERREPGASRVARLADMCLRRKGGFVIRASSVHVNFEHILHVAWRRLSVPSVCVNPYSDRTALLAFVETVGSRWKMETDPAPQPPRAMRERRMRARSLNSGLTVDSRVLASRNPRAKKRAHGRVQGCFVCPLTLSLHSALTHVPLSAQCD